MKKGIVYFVGAGPGHPKLITLRGMEVLAKSDVVVYDRLASPLLLKYLKPGAQKVYVGKRPDRHTMKQEEINQLLVKLALEGKTITRLKGGDPGVFGRVGEEAELLAQHGIEYEIVPGVTSASAVPLYAGIPVTHRDYNSTFCVITGHEKPEKLDSMICWDKLALASETLIFLMGVAKIRYIRDQLIKHGRDPDTPVALVRWGTRSEQETMTGTLATIAEQVEAANFLPPAVIVVGKVVQLREKLLWYEKKPLFGVRVLITRARTAKSRMAEAIEELGGEAVEFPVIAFRHPESRELIERRETSLRQLKQCDWIFFTSVTGVEYFFDLLIERNIDIRELYGKKIVAVGPQTAEALRKRGLLTESIPPEYTAPALVEHMRDQWKPGQKALLPRGNLARETLPQALAQSGVEVFEMPVYETVMPEQVAADECVRMLEEGEIQVVTFTSSSTVQNLVTLIERFGRNPVELLGRTLKASIGPITAETLKQYGLKVDIMAREATVASLVEAIAEHYRRGTR
jgi:uroporphyrinogen III methyltransferase/synthase